jgi:hypothetical protein
MPIKDKYFPMIIFLYQHNLLEIDNWLQEDILHIQRVLKDHSIVHEYLHIFSEGLQVLVVLVRK